MHKKNKDFSPDNELGQQHAKLTSEIDNLKKTAGVLGTITWGLLLAQVILFLIGLLSLGIAAIFKTKGM